MGLNKQKGNMYGFVTHTWNAIKGRCSHGCEYCYMIPFWKSNVHLDKKELKTNLGEGNFIFVGSGTDMFAEDVPKEWIIKVLEHCKRYNNTYLFQTKNPRRLNEFFRYFVLDLNGMVGITLETNRGTNSNAPSTYKRAKVFKDIFVETETFVTIEPIMDFDLDNLVGMIEEIKPKFVNIGADSKGHKLPEPSPEKIKELIKELEKFTKVNLKENLKRLIPYIQETKQ